MAKHLVVVSVDALVFEDLEYAKTLPNFGKILSTGAIIERVTTIYPSLTHPVHASIMCGRPAGDTGVIANTVFDMQNGNGVWFNDFSQLKCETIFHAAKKAGLTTASCRWPLTEHAGEVIDYLVPEVFGKVLTEYENPADAYRATGTSECIMDIVQKAIDIYGAENDHPNYDEFEIYCSAEIIKRYKPSVLFTHPGQVDHIRHVTGVFSDEVKKAVELTDKWIGMLFEALRDAEIENQTDIVILSDHGQLNIVRKMHPNTFLADAGYIETDKDGKITSWKAFAHSCSLSSQIYLSEPENKELYDGVYELLQRLACEKIYGFERVFTKDEVKERYGLDGGFSFVIETDGYTAFAEEIKRPAVTELDTSDYRFGKATHGHMPEKGPQPTFFGMGPSFKTGACVKNCHVIDHASTFAKILGIDFPSGKGKSIDEILK